MLQKKFSCGIVSFPESNKFSIPFQFLNFVYRGAVSTK
ncbi:hypothetical protein LEP1GSC132_1741 [Leptospira kirschneri str. 200803703]|uniref:Uncharacterized protein n=3 Tax=Leptospira kirschneri TaxID=29507 RepID=A0A0E2B1M4_9LEPT|nr:hypothetical protein LEP1GSC044_2266 [Leptospira kirschneri serovar Grippotyphosa str. RM52]EKO14662.1 hypothetical protein LEP1GSC081_1638 [Leptospira kirschneri str. H1]EKO51097.1 hypothetical protein LEP1GSC131_2329 [Leptospira kirschneri str. 200802841]EKO61036.1 hypothetical protein LEP1GSC082_2818 [Leptospira kirschneri str. H2]EKP03556.1 hypothetical protein LEP1GSC018_3033 [Leptospira kirschneri str. 2008720114]EKQ81878.1 hypothetical protein LEP1GSC064_0229 [Leptospira kirschneri s